MDSTDENDGTFDSSADLFVDNESVLAVHNDDKTVNSQPLFIVDGNATRATMAYDERQPLQQKMSNNLISGTGTITQTPISSSDNPVAQYEILAPLDRDTEVCNVKCPNSSTCHETNNVDMVFQEELFEDHPKKRHKYCESDIIVDLEDNLDTVSVSDPPSDKADSCTTVGPISEDNKVIITSAAILDIDNNRLLGTSALNGNAVLVRNDLPKNYDSNCEEHKEATYSDVVMDELNPLLLNKELITVASSRVIEEQSIAGMSSNTQHTNILQNTSSLSNTPELICPFCNIQQDSLYLMEIHIEALHSEFSNGNGEEAAILNQDGYPFVSNGDIFQFVCPFCDLDLGDRVTLDLHLLTIHEEEQNEQSVKQETCPLCGFASDVEESMKLHIATHSADQTVYGISETGQAVHSAPFTPPVMACPVCGLKMTDADLLYSHVESHFNSRHKPGPDLVLATNSKQASNRDNIQMRSNAIDQRDLSQSYKEIQTMPSTSQNNIPSSQGRSTPSSSKENVSYKRQYEQNLEKAVAKGEMSVTDYHEHKLLMAETDMLGVDNGSTRTEGLIEKLELLYRSQARTGQAVYLCSPTDHYSGSYGDKGWGCGYRNFQMLLSCLSRHQGYAQRIFAGKSTSVPSIPKIQQLIELAWKKGFDPQGCSQLRGQLVNTSKWIGATEIAATLSSLGIRCRLADFHAPSSPDGTHPRLLEWVSDYFCTRQQGFLPPLYLQHQGHSRTIIGVEKEHGTIKLLLFDPGIPRDHMASIARDQLSWKHMRTFRRTQAGFKAKQYQILAVTGFLTDLEYKDSKTLKSEQVS